MDRTLFNEAMRSNRPSIFVNNMARYIFGKETLIKSTVSGENSRRKKNFTEDETSEKPSKLDSDSLELLRGLKVITLYISVCKYPLTFERVN